MEMRYIKMRIIRYRDAKKYKKVRSEIESAFVKTNESEMNTDRNDENEVNIVAKVIDKGKEILHIKDFNISSDEFFAILIIVTEILDLVLEIFTNN